jgi:hypothetical protein
MDRPRQLFKYFDPSRVDFLRSMLIRFTPLGAFNDPFEGRPEVLSVMPEGELNASISEMIESEIEIEYAKLPQEARLQISKEKYASLFRELIEKQTPQISAGVRSITPHFVQTIHSKFDELIGALCLSEVPDSLLMWAHYAASHAGFVVEFDPTDAFFNSRRTDSDEFGFLRRVLYRDARPSGALTSMTEELFTVKSSHWSYEREWRMLRPLPHADETISTDNYPIHLFRLPCSAVRRIILGARSTQKTKSEIRTILTEQGASLRHVELHQSRPDDSHFVLRIEKAA